MGKKEKTTADPYGMTKKATAKYKSTGRRYYMKTGWR